MQEHWDSLDQATPPQLLPHLQTQSNPHSKGRNLPFGCFTMSWIDKATWGQPEVTWRCHSPGHQHPPGPQPSMNQ